LFIAIVAIAAPVAQATDAIQIPANLENRLTALELTNNATAYAWYVALSNAVEDLKSRSNTWNAASTASIAATSTALNVSNRVVLIEAQTSSINTLLTWKATGWTGAFTNDLAHTNLPRFVNGLITNNVPTP
jgi:hypothetical protein